MNTVLLIYFSMLLILFINQIILVMIFEWQFVFIHAVLLVFVSTVTYINALIMKVLILEPSHELLHVIVRVSFRELSTLILAILLLEEIREIRITFGFK